MKQTKLDWEFENGRPRINPEKLREEILRSFFDAGFVIDFGNGIVAENYEEYKLICEILEEVKNENRN